MLRAAWETAPSNPSPPPHPEIQVWRVRLERAGDLSDLLSPAELRRADRLCFEQHRRRYIAARGTLRLLLGRYLDRDPRDIEFEHGRYGKPSLPGSSLRFNATDSGDLALYAFAREREVGIDLEKIRPERPIERLARRCFTRAELESFSELPEGERPAAFFSSWCRKEAYIKARGESVWRSLRRADLSVGPREPPRVVRADDADRWTLKDLEAGQGYSACVVVEGNGWSLRAWDGA